jgi:hypothetical protein
MVLFNKTFNNVKQCLTSTFNNVKQSKMAENNKKKYIGFRVAIPQYISIINSADALNISITDYLLSKIFTLQNENTVKQQTTEQITPVVIQEQISLKKLNKTSISEIQFSKEHEKLLTELNNKNP